MLRALDICCKQGGATKGLQRVGFHVTGVDIEAQPNYCGGAFVRANALDLPFKFLRRFDFIWASPPCQAHTALKVMANAGTHANLIPPMRAMLRDAERPYVIENVEGAPLCNPFMLCGTQFGLGIETHELRRHRIFESNIPALAFPRRCKHRKTAIGIYGDHARAERIWRGKGSHFPDAEKVAIAGRAMDIDWMDWDGLTQAIPPAYSEFIARAWLKSRETP